MSVIESYYAYQRDVIAKYGEKTVVLFQLGKFYDIFEWDLPERKIGLVWELKENLPLFESVRITKYNGGEHQHDLKHPYMLGFPEQSYTQYCNVLLHADYTVVKVEQVGDGEKCKSRSITEVLCKSLNINKIENLNVISNYVVALFVDVVEYIPQKPEHSISLIGCSSVDLSTGEMHISEYFSTTDNPTFSVKETYRFLSTYKPQDLIIYIRMSNKTQCSDIYEKYLTIELETRKIRRTIIRSEIPKDFLKTAYQDQVFQKVFGNEKKLEYLYSKTYACISSVAILQFCYDHDENLVLRITPPKVTNSDQRLILTHNAIKQLNLVSNHDLDLNNKINSVFSVINYTATNMGKRKLHDTLLNPYTNPEKMQMYYDCINILLNDTQLLENIKLRLKGISDIAKLHRKILLARIQPSDFWTLYRSYKNCAECYNLVSNSQLRGTFYSKDNSLKSLFRKYLKYIKSTFNFQYIRDANIVDRTKIGFTHIFINAKKLDITLSTTKLLEIQEEYINLSQKLVEYKTKFDQIIIDAGKASSVKLDYDEKKREYNLLTVTTNYRYLNTKYKNLEKVAYKGGKIALFNKELKEILPRCGALRWKVERLLYKIYVDIIESIQNTYIKVFDYIVDFISELDYIVNGAICAKNNGYHKPNLVSDNKTSQVKVNDMRHPLSEKVSKYQYIPTDIDLTTKKGMLLYGANAGGKTTLARALALSVIFAQMGYYTAGEITFVPYKKIMTRLTGNDNIYKGYSSGQVEMMELNTILCEANLNTLVVGDEICRGTEIESGMAITIQTISQLTEVGSTFVFCTHMHSLPMYPIVKEVIDSNKLSVYHLDSYFDEVNRVIIYNRKLVAGSGERNYGIRFAQSVGLPSQFIESADKIRRDLLGIKEEIVSTKKSRYNSKKYVDRCELCGVGLDLTTHHIEEQNLADTNGMINHFHKNAVFNLMILCNQCHTTLHKNNQKVKVLQTVSKSTKKIST